jgi:hypothetical protein
MKEITGALYFSDHEPRIIGHLKIGEAHYEIVGLRRSKTRADLRGHKIEGQGDLFDACCGGQGKRDLV